jgi:hypothetical protein
MKTKWLIILFIFFLGVILLSLLVAQQSQKIVSLSEKEIPVTEQAENRVSSAYSPQQVPIAALPLGESGITIIKGPAIESVEKNLRVSKREDKAIVVSNTEAKNNPQSAIIKKGKQPTSQEAQEMNSRGIVLY